MKRMRVAVILPGGVGAGDFSQGYPPMMSFLDKLFVDFDIIVYSIHPVNKDFVSATYHVSSAPRFISSTKLRVIYIAFIFCLHQCWKPSKLIHGFWVYPAGTLAVILAKIFRKVSIVTVQGGEAAAIHEIAYGNLLKKKLKRITLWTCEKATCLNSISHFLISQLKQHDLKRNDAVVIPFGSQKTNLHEQPRGDRLRILHIANLTEVKDQRTLLNAFAMICKKIPAHLTIIGGDYMNGSIQRHAKELGLHDTVTFMGPMPHDSLMPYYLNSHIMMHTSLHEGQSGVVTDAMARGLLVVGTRVGIIADLGAEYFQVAAVKDAETLSTLTLAAWHNHALSSRLRNAAFEWSQAHDDWWTAGQYRDLYRSLADK